MFSVSCVRSDVRTSCDFVRFFPDRKLKRCATGPNQICKWRNPRFRRAWGTIRRTNLPRELDRCEFNIINVRIATIFNRASPEGRAGGNGWALPGLVVGVQVAISPASAHNQSSYYQRSYALMSISVGVILILSGCPFAMFNNCALVNGTASAKSSPLTA